MTGLDLIGLGAFLLLFFFVGWWGTSRVKNEEEYLMAGRGIGLFPLVATLVMTEFNTSTLIAFTSVAEKAGLWALSLPLIFFIGLSFYSITVAKRWKEYNGYSVAGFFTEKYGPFFGKGVSIALLVAMVGFSAVYVKSMTLLFAPLFPTWNFWVLSAFLTACVLLMVARGGLVAVVRTDVVSFLFLCFLLPCIAFFGWSNGELPELNVSESLPLWLVVSLTLLTMFTYIISPWYGQKIFAAKNPQVAKKGVLLAAVLVFVFYGSAVFATACFQESFPALIGRLPGGIRGVSYAFLFAAAATTLSGIWSAMASVLVGDFLNKGYGVQRGLLLTLGFASLSYLLANTLIDEVFPKLVLANIPIFALSFSLLAGFYWKRVTTLSAQLSMVVGLFWGVFCYLYFGEEGGYQWYWVMIGLPLVFGSGAGCVFLQEAVERLTRISNHPYIS